MLNKIVLSIIKISIIAVLVSVLFIVSEQKKVSADAAPMPGAIGSDLNPNLNATKVRMEAETVLITIPENSDYWSGHSIVTATFYMRNTSDETEEMKARFPMNMSEYSMGYEIKNGVEYCSYISNFPSIDELSVFVDGEQVNISTTENDIDMHELWGAPEGTIQHIKCWAHFDVRFPPGEQVIIQIQYKVAGYKWDPRLVSYKYIMQTGQGWLDTIGSADIVIQLPYEINEYNLRSCSPDECSVIGNTIKWHFENFEPENNIEIEIIDPSIWSRVVREKINVEKDPKDGEAWGRLGMAYKESIRERHGFILSDCFPEIYYLSEEAYLHALEIFPDDIDWHFGYAELICKNTMFLQNSNSQEDIEQREICTEELKYILDRDPDHENTLLLLERMRNMTKSYPDGEIAEYLVLTPMPTRTITPTKPTETATITGTNTPTIYTIFLEAWTDTPAPTKTQTINISTPTPTTKITQSANAQQNRLLFAVGANILFIVLFFLAIRSDQPDK